MDSFNLLGFLESYTLPSLIISAITAVAYILFDRFFSEKIKFSVKSYFPFATGILLNFLFELISTKRLSFGAEIFSSGILCGSLATMVFALFKRIKRGETAKFDAVLMIIEGIICDYVSDSAINVTAMAIRSILYDVTSLGKDVVEKELCRLHEITRIATEIMGGKV